MKRSIIVGMMVVNIFLCLSATNAFSSNRMLIVPHVYQEYETHWCWAAAPKMLMDYYGTYVDLCTILGDAAYDCYYDCYDPQCKSIEAADLCSTCSQILSYYGNIGSSSIVGALLYDSAGSGVKQQIDANKPFIVRWQRNSQYYDPAGGHAVVVIGYDDNNTQVVYHDSKYPPGGTYPTDGDFVYMSYSYFVGSTVYPNAYPNAWTHTVTLNDPTTVYKTTYYNDSTVYSGRYNKLDFYGCESSTNTVWHGIATCRGYWEFNPCAWTSYCSTSGEWEFNPSNFTNTGAPCPCTP